MKHPRKRIIAMLLVFVSILLAIIMLRWFEHSQVYHPTRTLEPVPMGSIRPAEDFFFKTGDGAALNGWFFSAPTNSPRRDLVALVCHGNGGNISHRLELAETLQSTGVNVLLFDYRGYGRSEGRPSEEGTYQDAEAAYEWLRRKGFSPQTVIAFGESLGGGVAAELARRTQIGGLILQSTFTSIPDIGADLFPWLPVRWLARIHYDTRRKLPRVTVPVLVMHSRADDLIPFRHAEKNFAAANQPKLFAEIHGGHNDALADRESFRAGLEALFEMLRSQPRLGRAPP